MMLILVVLLADHVLMNLFLDFQTSSVFLSTGIVWFDYQVQNLCEIQCIALDNCYDPGCYEAI